MSKRVLRRPDVWLLAALVGVSVAASPLLGQAMASNVVNVVWAQSTRGIGTSWLRPDPRTTMLWSAERHVAWMEVGSPATQSEPSLLSRFTQWSAGAARNGQANEQLAMLWLMLGNWSAAAPLLDAAQRDGTLRPPPPSTAYGFEALAGIAALERGDAVTAVGHLQRAAWLGGDRSAADGVYRNLDLALAALYQRQAAATPAEWKTRYLAAKYADVAGDPRSAAELQQLRDESGLASADAADLRVRLASRSLDNGDSASAATLLREAAGFDARGSTLADEVGLLRRLGLGDEAAQMLARVKASPPRFPVGKAENQSWIAEPLPVTADWRLEGYDLDEQQLRDGAQLDVLLYWRDRQNQLVLERRVLTNLAPDGGFNWRPVDASRADQGITSASGYEGGVYGEAASTDRVAEFGDDPGHPHALLLDNAAALTRSGVFSVAAIPVQPGSMYLEAAWRKGPGRGLIGRSCASDTGSGGVYFVGDGGGSDAWQYFAGIAQPLAGGAAADTCHVFLGNIESATPTWITDVLFTAISAPGPGIIADG